MEKRTYEKYRVEKSDSRITLEVPRKPNEVKVSISLDQIFEDFVGKMVKITIEEVEA